jgi:molybdenum cofactor cytidylyltransferase
MIAPEQVAVVLLAAGSSSRFGPADKLSASLNGVPLGLHAAGTIARLPFALKIAVTRPGGPDFASLGFNEIVNPDPASGQSGSIKLGLAAARQVDPAAVLIALADMPYVTGDHLVSLMNALDDEHPVVASNDGQRSSPPALFARTHLFILEQLEGDVGARVALRGGLAISAPAVELLDVDVPDDLTRAGAQS